MNKISEQLARVIAGAYDNAGDKESFMAARAYHYWRAKGLGAYVALARARADAAAGTARYHESGLASYRNKPNERGGRWIESPAMAGLRFVGWSDKLASIEHNGWFLDREFQEEVARGAVYQLPARKGRAVYVEAARLGKERKGGWQEQCGRDGAAIVYLNCLHYGEPGGDEYASTRDNEQAARDAARGADREAEILAERESEYQEDWREGSRVADMIEQARASRADARKLLPDYRRLEPGNVREAIRERICDDMRRARRLYAKAREAVPYRPSDAWREGFSVDWKGVA